MSQRDKVKLTEQETQEFLALNMKVQIASLERDGAPHLSTLFYVLEQGRIAFWTYARSQKIVNLERDPRVSALVEDGTDYFELRGVSIQGTARIVRDADELFAIGSRVACRMAGVERLEDLGEFGMAQVRKQATKRVAVVIEPDTVATWDHRKMLD